MNTLVASRTDAAWRVLAGVLDPEVPALSVVDLGIVRGVSESDDGALEVILTPTYSGCPAVEVIEADIVAALEATALGPVRIRTQRAPAWTSDWISAEGRRKLHDYGIAPPGPVSEAVLADATLKLPPKSAFRSEAKRGRHSEHMGLLLAEMQVLQRSFPGGVW